MNNNELLTISAYAELKGISKQAVYKKLNNKLNKYLIVVEGKKYLDRAVLNDDELNQVEQPFNQNRSTVEQQLKDDLIPLLEKQIEEKDKQIEKLFQQIEEKDAQINTLHNLLNQSQQLQAIDRKLLLETNQKKKKKGLLKLFSRKESTDNERNI